MEMGMPASIQKVCELSDDTKLTCIDILESKKFYHKK